MMDNMTMAWHQTESPLLSTACGLYQMALCAVGDAVLAGPAAAGAFADALNRIPDTFDIGLFRMQCYSLLYRHCKKVRGHACCHKQLSGTLACLDFDERFILLLFCLQKYSVRQIAKITRLPGFVIEKRLNSAVGKVTHKFA